jgi:hypothetical protein
VATRQGRDNLRSGYGLSMWNWRRGKEGTPTRLKKRPYIRGPTSHTAQEEALQKGPYIPHGSRRGKEGTQGGRASCNLEPEPLGEGFSWRRRLRLLGVFLPFP